MIGPIAKDAEAPAIPAAISLVAGIWLGAWSISGAAGALVLAAAVLLFLAIRPRRVAAARAAWCLFWLAVGFASGLLRIAGPAETSRHAAWSLPSLPERVDRVEGTLVDFWSGAPPRARSRVRAEWLWTAGSWRPFPADVYLFVSGETPVEPLADRGDRVRLVGHLRAEDLSPSERDLSLPWPAYRLSVKSAVQIESRGRSLLSVLNLPNRWLHRSIPSAGPDFDRDVRGPLSALLLGRTSDLDRGMVARYRRGGLYHLLVVSGLHVGLAAGLVFASLRWLGIRGKRRDALLLVSVILFVIVAGANPPAVRAGIVFAIFLSTRLLERPISALQAIGLSALVLFLVAPVQIFSVGTILTFAAVLGIALLAQEIRTRLPEKPRWLFSGLATAFAAEIGTAPILFWRFNLVAAGAWLTAPLAIPLAGGMIALGAILLTAFAAGLHPSPLVFLFALGSRVLEFCAERAAGMAFLRPTPHLAAILVLIALIVTAALAPVRVKRLATAAASVLFLFLAFRAGPRGPQRGFSLEALDVGQGDALLLRWQRHAVLVDGGGPFDLDARDFGRTRLLPKLLDRGVTRLDAAVLTHPHPDHALGLFAVLEELPVARLWRSAGQDEGDLYRRLAELARTVRVPVTVLTAGSSVRWRDATLTILHSGGRRWKIDATNNQSIVALFERDGRRALLTGDAGAATEAGLLRAGRVPRADVLKIGHHGSRGSTTPDFLAAVAPKAALLSCGRGNRFGHPASETLRTLRALRVPLLRTDVFSDVRLDLLPEGTRLAWRGLL